MKVLIVDDDEAIATTFSLLISYYGHEVESALEGSRALEIACEWRPHFVLLDLLMPGMDGYTLAQKLRERSGLGHTKIIAMSGHPVDEGRYSEAGFDGLLPKPVMPDVIRQVLSN